MSSLTKQPPPVAETPSIAVAPAPEPALAIDTNGIEDEGGGGGEGGVVEPIAALLLADDMLAQRFHSIRNSLASTDSYAASIRLRERLSWLKDGRHFRLVWKHDVSQADDLYKSSVTDRVLPNPIYVPDMVLSTIVFITDEDFWLMADGAWRGPSDFSLAFADINLSCTGTAHPYPFLQQDFNAAIANIEHFMKKSETHGSKRVGVLINSEGIKIIRFHHVPFMPLDRGEGRENDDEIGDHDKDGTIDLADWPANSEPACRALQDMQTTHVAQLLPAFDMHGDCISPSEYDRALRSVSAHIRFTICKYSWWTGGMHKDTYVANIDMIRVIMLPHPHARVPSNCKRALKVDVYMPAIRPSIKQCQG